jgi:hypothetical protein
MLARQNLKIISQVLGDSLHESKGVCTMRGPSDLLSLVPQLGHLSSNKFTVSEQSEESRPRILGCGVKH